MKIDIERSVTGSRILQVRTDGGALVALASECADINGNAGDKVWLLSATGTYHDLWQCPAELPSYEAAIAWLAHLGNLAEGTKAVVR